MEERFFTTFQAAKICHASPGSILRWIREGKLPASLTAGGHHRIRSSDLNLLLRKLKLPGPPSISDRGSSLVVSAAPSHLKQIRKLLKRRFPEAAVRESHEPIG